MITEENRRDEFHIECNPTGLILCCERCDTAKPLNQFSRNKTNRSGYETECKACRKEQGLQRTFVDRLRSAKQWIIPYPRKKAVSPDLVNSFFDLGRGGQNGS